LLKKEKEKLEKRKEELLKDIMISMNLIKIMMRMMMNENEI
jgi:hypothetical protein